MHRAIAVVFAALSPMAVDGASAAAPVGSRAQDLERARSACVEQSAAFSPAARVAMSTSRGPRPTARRTNQTARRARQAMETANRHLANARAA